MTFGMLIKNKRIELNYSLREFCIKFKHDPSNWSKVERDLLYPPDDEDTLRIWAEQLNIVFGSKEWFEFYDMAFLSRKKIPKDLLSDDEVIEKLPLFFRTLRGQKPSEEELKSLADLLKKS
ncbi:MAG: hypothetical protein ABIJ40_14505 [Bacteroidota bacterium]